MNNFACKLAMMTSYRNLFNSVKQCKIWIGNLGRRIVWHHFNSLEWTILAIEANVGAPSGWRHKQPRFGVLVFTQNPIRQYPTHFEFRKWWVKKRNALRHIVVSLKFSGPI